jgi:hypothetical protein
MFLVAGCVVEEEEPLHTSGCEPFKNENVDHVVYLGKQVFGHEPTIPVLARPE